MPDRILRCGLFNSEAWLGLKNNDDRVCWIALFESADNLGNQPAGPFRLMRLWRAYGIETPEKVAKVLLELADVDLIRTYQIEGKPYVHIPRFGQSTRYPGHLYPPPPFATSEQKQVYARKSPVNHRGSQRLTEDHRDSPDGVGVGVVDVLNTNLQNSHARAREEAEKFGFEKQETQTQKTTKASGTFTPVAEAWHETKAGVMATAKTFNLRGQLQNESDDAYTDFVRCTIEAHRRHQAR
jgi:hypothetical protein